MNNPLASIQEILVLCVAVKAVVREGEPIKELMFIKEGQCSAIAKVPTRTRTMKVSLRNLFGST